MANKIKDEFLLVALALLLGVLGNIFANYLWWQLPIDDNTPKIALLPNLVGGISGIGFLLLVYWIILIARGVSVKSHLRKLSKSLKSSLSC
ncbi:MAG TPA: hypothetical protein ACFYEL_10145 [Candidatus Wunengus californicus]|uniref:hypothetical protein n=1 Tax=Candidatus Wunengus californicus TaxID=3367619 RepID=UPI00402734AA